MKKAMGFLFFILSLTTQANEININLKLNDQFQNNLIKAKVIPSYTAKRKNPLCVDWYSLGTESRHIERKTNLETNGDLSSASFKNNINFCNASFNNFFQLEIIIDNTDRVFKNINLDKVVILMNLEAVKKNTPYKPSSKIFSNCTTEKLVPRVKNSKFYQIKKCQESYGLYNYAEIENNLIDLELKL